MSKVQIDIIVSSFNKTVNELLNIADKLKQTEREKLILEKAFSRMFILKTSGIPSSLIELTCNQLVDNADDIINKNFDKLFKKIKDAADDKTLSDIVEIVSAAMTRIKKQEMDIIHEKFKVLVKHSADYLLAITN